MCLGAAAAVFLIAGCTQTSGEEGRVSPLARTGENAADFDGGTTPISANTYLAAGRLAESRGDLPTAAGQYRLALEKNPRHPETLYRLGVVQSRQEDPQAVETWKQYIAATGGSATGLANLGFCHELLGDPAAAEAAYLRGIARDPRNTSCRVNYGMLLASRGDYEAGARQMTHVLPPAQAWYNVGSVCERQGKNADAISAYRTALAHDSSFVVAQKRLNALHDLEALDPASRPTTTQSAAPRPADSQ